MCHSDVFNFVYMYICVCMYFLVFVHKDVDICGLCLYYVYVRIKAVLDFTLLQKLTNNMKNVSQKGEGLTV